MGVPKFYRWISERYPCLSEVIKEHQVPEFDNLYLDMNGIIHTCSHPNDNDPHFRITEEKIFQDILHYIEVLFRIIKPKRTFFMAVDGVAPRAKMNQQRGRRFRSAKEAEAGIQEAIRKGETLPSEKRFDSNCITPGTAFMERLQTQLEYFVKTKITHDRMWQGINVYLSGHETPGEGEHKVMEYIRYERSQPGYDPNIRHCLYGLDADLLMLALCTHEPHFSLLREEVKFTQKKGNSRTARAEETTFHLLHISLLREYIDHEFGALKTTLPFKYDLESVIDDWVLMGFLVGNDFIPHLPDLHIATSALPFLYQTYMRVMPTLGGYLNENGVINQTRFQSFLDGIASFDYDHFEEAYDDYKWLASKSKERKAASKAQEGVEHGASNFHKTEAKSIQIVKDLAVQQGIMTPSEGSESLDEVESEDGDTFMQEFKLHKKSYYEEKFKITYTKEAVSRIAFEYILGLQWICHYYYNGVQSWSWYYPYHYSPYMSDLKNVASMKLKFKMNKPFLPFQQLLAVLPAASNDCIPEAYWYLMDENASPIGDFYPTKFSTDLNGKQQDWEAVVLIPFIDENRLLNAMDPCKSKLTAAESKRNRHGPCQLYTYDPNSPYLLKSTLSGIFPDVDACCASKELIPLHLWIKKDYHTFVKGLLPGCHLSVYYQGFPTLYHLQHKAFLKKAGVKVFQSMSRGENMILKISSGNDSDTSREGFAAAEHPDESLESVSQRLLGKSVYINWPHMEEAKVVAVSDSKVKYQMCEQVSGSRGSKHKLVRKELDGRECEEFFGQVHDIHEKCKFRRGIDVGSTRVLVYAQVLQGHKYICGKKGEITLEKQWSGVPTAYPLQATVQGISVQHPSFQRLETIGDLFPENAEVFNLGLPHYGCVGKVIQAQGGNTTVKFQVPAEPDFGTIAGKMQKLSLYHPGWKVASMVGISSYLLSRITGSIYVFYPVTQRWNVGLNLRFSKENAGIAGFTKKQNNQWLYSDAVAELLQQYLKKFPEVIDYLATALEQKSESEFDAEKMFKSDNVTEKLQELAKWLKSLPSYDGQRVNENSNALEPSVVKLIDETVANFKANNTEPPTEVMVGVRPHFLYRPLTQQGTLIPDKNAQHQLLDRVVNVRDGYTVPLRFRGTIIGVHDERSKDKEVMFDVLFDDEFLGGLTLGGRCPQRKGYKLPACAIINLSHGDRLANKGNKPMAVVRPHHHASTPRGGRDIPKGPNIKQSHFVQSPHSAFRPTQKPSSAPSARNTQPVTLLQRSSPSSPSRNSKKTPAVTSKFSSENDFENMWESLKQSSPSASSQKQKGRNPTKPTTKSPKPGKPEQTKESVASKRKQEFSLKQAAKTLPKVTNSPVSQPTVKQTTANVKSTASHNRPLDTSRASGSAAASTATAWTVDGVNQPKGAVPATITGTTSASSVQAKNAFLSEVIKNALNVSSPAPSTSSQSAAAPVLVKAAPFSHAGTASGLRPTQPPPVDDLLRTLRLSSPPQAQPSRQISIQELMESCRNRVPAGNSSTEPLLTPESFVVRQSKKSAESRGGAEATSVLQKEGTDTLCDILDIGSQEDKVKEESECGTTWSTASPDNAQNDCDDEEDDANQGDSERDLEVENAKSKKHVSGEKIEDKVRSTSVEKGSADEQGATTGQSKVDQLLRWCQATGVFPPLYTYCDSAQDKGKFHATVQLWNGLSFQSPPYASNEQAMETAASTALGYLERLRHNPANQRTTQQMYPLQSVPPPVMVAPNPYMMAGASPYPMPFPGALPGQPIPPYFVVPPPPMGPAGAPVSGPPTSHTPASVRPSALPPFMANYGQIAPDGSYIIPPQVTHQQRPPAFAPRFAADDSATHPHLYAQAMRPDHPYGYPTSPGRFYAPGPPSQAAYARPMYVLADKTFIPPQVLKQHAQFVSALSPHPQTKATPMTVSSAPSTQYILSDSPAPPEETATTPVKQDGYDAKGLSASAPRLAQSRAPRHIKAAEGASGKRKATLAISFTGPK